MFYTKLVTITMAPFLEKRDWWNCWNLSKEITKKPLEELLFKYILMRKQKHAAKNIYI